MMSSAFKTLVSTNLRRNGQPPSAQAYSPRLKAWGQVRISKQARRGERKAVTLHYEALGFT